MKRHSTELHGWQPGMHSTHGGRHSSSTLLCHKVNTGQLVYLVPVRTGRTCKPATFISLLVAAGLAYLMYQRYSSTGKVMPAGAVAGISGGMAGEVGSGGNTGVPGRSVLVVSLMVWGAAWAFMHGCCVLPPFIHPITGIAKCKVQPCSTLCHWRAG
jgi:hypothetical protein